MPTTEQSNNYPHFFYALRGKWNADFVGESVEGNQPPSVPSCCEPCFVLPVLAQISGTDALKNDFTTVAHNGKAASDTFTFTIEKADANGNFNTSIALANGVNGTGYPIGSISDAPFVAAFKVDWQKILQSDGEGFYRVKTVATGVQNYDHYSFVYCLKEYSEIRADKTTRFDWELIGEQPDINSWRLKSYYGAEGLSMQIRVGGGFGYISAEYEQREVDFSNGLTHEYGVDTRPKYKFKSGLYYYLLHEHLMFNVFPSGTVKATDYNLNNHHKGLKNIPIIISSGYDPKYEQHQSILTRVQCEFKDAKWDFRRRNCN